MSAPAPDPIPPVVASLERRLAREREARKQAESLLEKKSLALFEAAEAAREATRKMELALWASGEAVWEWDAASDTLRSSQIRNLGEPPETREMLFLDYVARIDEEDADRVALAWRLHASGDSGDFDVQFRDVVSGRWLRVRGRATERDAAGAATMVQGTAKDVTELRQIDDSLQLLGLAFANATEPLLLCNAEWRILEANHAFSALTGLPAHRLVGSMLTDHLPALLEGDDLADSELRRRIDVTLHSGAHTIPVDITATRLGDPATATRRWIVSVRDLSESKRRAAEDSERSRIDLLTGLPNRLGLQSEITGRLQASEGDPLPILWFNLDGFRTINEALGSREADHILAQCAQRIASSQPEGWGFGRWAGDEFIAIGPSGDDVQRAQRVAQAALASVAEPIEVQGRTLRITASAGIAVYPEDGESVEALIQSAGVALRAAKRGGRARLQAYHPQLDEDGLRRLTLVNQLRRASDLGDFGFVAQPRVGVDRRIAGHEVLIRWHTAEWGPVSPAVFIPLAEENGMIERIGRLAVRASGRLSARLRGAGHDERVSVNLSARQLADDGLVDMLLAELLAADVRPPDIELEVTESGLVVEMDRTVALLGELRRQGFSLSLDDFGTGYSSLSYLQSLPFHKVKLDRSFLRSVVSDQRSRHFVRSVVDLCGALGMAVVAEGVENGDQFEVLRDMGIAEFQGFHFHRPIAFDAILALPR